jgi:DNA topoisomerase IB
LYAARPRPNNNEISDNFYQYCPKLSMTQRENMDKEISLLDLTKAFNMCKDSSPGPDGIPYQV